MQSSLKELYSFADDYNDFKGKNVGDFLYTFVCLQNFVVVFSRIVSFFLDCTMTLKEKCCSWLKISLSC